MKSTDLLNALAGDDELKWAFCDIVHDMLKGRWFLGPIDGINHYGLPNGALLGNVLRSGVSDNELKGVFRDMMHDMFKGHRFLDSIDRINHYGLPGRAILGNVLEIWCGINR
ncbi:hypothetical protein NL676_038152 [Syzygium grande]|nr:hypothetical protein NL676_038152 [Syzygium grande]